MPGPLARRLDAAATRLAAPSQLALVQPDPERLDALVAEYMALTGAPAPRRADLERLDVTQLVNLYFRIARA